MEEDTGLLISLIKCTGKRNEKENDNELENVSKNTLQDEILDISDKTIAQSFLNINDNARDTCKWLTVENVESSNGNKEEVINNKGDNDTGDGLNRNAINKGDGKNLNIEHFHKSIDYGDKPQKSDKAEREKIDTSFHQSASFQEIGIHNSTFNIVHSPDKKTENNSSTERDLSKTFLIDTIETKEKSVTTGPRKDKEVLSNIDRMGDLSNGYDYINNKMKPSNNEKEKCNSCNNNKNKDEIDNIKKKINNKGENNSNENTDCVNIEGTIDEDNVSIQDRPKNSKPNLKELEIKETTECGDIHFKTPYVCAGSCDFLSSSVDNLKHHLVTKHTLASDHLCSLCSQRFALFDKFFEHLPVHYKENKLIFKCYTDNCSQIMHRLVDFKLHISSSHCESTLFTCSFCFKSKPSYDCFIEHVQKHIRNVSKCVYCDSIFFSKEEIFAHLRSDHEGKPRRINIETEIVAYDRLQAQQRPSEISTASTDSGVSINCAGPDGVYVQPAAELVHQCVQCSYKTYDTGDISHHTHHHHSSFKDTLKYNCPSCHFSVDDRAHFVEHVVFHSDNLSMQYHMCSYCDQESTNEEWMKKHIKSRHENEKVVYASEKKNFKHLENLCLCPFCGDVLMWKERLAEHIRAIHGEINLADIIKNYPNENIHEIIFIQYTKSPSLSENFVIEKDLKVEPEFYEEVMETLNYDCEEDEEGKQEEKKSLVISFKKQSPRKQMYSCELCPFECTKQMNFKRHQAIHEKADLLKNCLKCGYCSFKHSRMNCIKFHLGKYHMDKPIKIISVNEEGENEIKMVSDVLTEKHKVEGLDDEASPKSSIDRDIILSKLLTKSDLDQYCDSFMPSGMIFKHPVKCTFCEYTNKVRINLKNHMRFHLEKRTKRKTKFQNDEESVKEAKECSSPEDTPSEALSIASSKTNEVTTKKMYKCAYCSMVSRWNKRDIVLHILHIHMLKKVFSCPYCNFGSSKAGQVVLQHCRQFHASKFPSVRNELKILNKIVPVKTEGGLIPIAFVADDVGPIMSLKQLGQHLQIFVRKNKYDNRINFDGESVVEKAIEKIKKEKNTSSAVNAYESCSNAMSEDSNDEASIENNEASIENDEASIENDEENPEKSMNSEDDSNVKADENSQGLVVEWRCLFCSHVALDRDCMEKHVLAQHLKCKMFSCPLCIDQFWHEKNVLRHMKKCHLHSSAEPIDLLNSKKQVIDNYIEKRMKNPIVTTSRKASFYYCKICSHVSSRHDKAKYHVTKKHLKVGLYICSQCHHYSATKISADRHIDDSHPDSKAYPQRSYDVYALFLQDNIQRISNNAPFLSSAETNGPLKSKNLEFFTCNVCNFVAESKLAFSAHSRIHKLYLCVYCDFTTNFLNKMQTHCYIKHPKKPIKHKQIFSAKCIHHSGQVENKSSTETKKDDVPSPKQIFPNKEFPGGRRGYKRSFKCEMFKCKLCVYKSNLHAVMRHHVMSHLTYQPYHCPYCKSYTAIRRNVVNNHIKMKHPGFEVKTICTRVEEMEIQVKDSYDKVAFVEKEPRKPLIKCPTGVKRHQKVYKSTQYKCCFCSLTTTFLRDIKQHLMREIDYRPYNCSICSYKDSSKPVVKRHCLRKHRGSISLENFNEESEQQLQELMTKCTFVVYREGKSSYSKADISIKKETNYDQADIPIVKISSKEDTLKSSLVYKRKMHSCTDCDFEDPNIRHVLLHRFKCHYKNSSCNYCSHVNSNILQLKKHISRCKSKSNIAYGKSSYLSIRKKMLQLSATERSYDSDTEENEEYLNEKWQEIVYCCHLCPSTFLNIVSFSSHMQTSHYNSSLMPKLEVIEGSLAKDKTKSYKCGFCSFVCTLFHEFEEHVAGHTDLPPLKCSLCFYASFTVSDIKGHSQAKHPGQPVTFDTLKQPYTMHPPPKREYLDFFPLVKLADIQHCLT